MPEASGPPGPDRHACLAVNGRAVEAAPGLSVLAALWSAGERAVRASVRGDGRGPLCGMGICFECRVTIDGVPHRRACTEIVPAAEAPMRVETRATGGATTLREDRRPAAAVERREAEVVVVGGGPAGLAAAVHAAEAGASVLLVDEAPRAGGQIWRHRAEPTAAARAWLERLGRSGARVFPGATVVDAPSRGEILVEHEGRPHRVRFDRLVLATGARERFLPFPGWTLPGVLGVGGAQALLKAGARFDGLRVVVAGSGPLLLAAAAGLAESGARIVAVVEQAPLQRLAAFGIGLVRHPRRIAEGLGYARRLLTVPYRAGAWVREAVGKERVERVVVTDGRRERARDCDVLACGFGLVPNLELPRLLGCAVDGEALVLDERQRTSVPGVFAAGELGGVAGLDHALVTGAIAGLGAAGRDLPERLLAARRRGLGFAQALARTFALRPEMRGLARPDTIVCRCEDVPLGRLDPSWSMREAKLRTRAGMGACQGRVCGAALSFLHGWPADTVRPPLTPVPIAVLEDGG